MMGLGDALADGPVGIDAEDGQLAGVVGVYLEEIGHPALCGTWDGVIRAR
jgi:hypothetical protein